MPSVCTRLEVMGSTVISGHSVYMYIFSCRNIRFPIYEGCDLSKEESRLIIMSMAVKNRMTDSGLHALLQIIDCHLPFKVHRSKYHFLQFFPKMMSCKYYFCPICFTLLTFYHDIITECNNCKNHYEEIQLERNYNFFYHFPLKPQLIELLNTKLFAKCRKTCPTENDIVDGKVSHYLKEQHVIRDNDITIQWNTDGVELFNSSIYTLWPIQVCINELPYRLRRENILLCGLWFYKEKPPMDLFLRPFIDELLELQTNGFQCVTFDHKEPILIKVHALFATVDTVARPLIQNIKQYNGIYGCSYCLHKGEQSFVGRGQTRIYSGDKKAMRKMKQHYKHVEKAIDEGKPVKGVKGPSVVMLLPTCHIIHSFPPEYMHSVLLGVTKLIATLWFDSANNNKDWYLGLKITEFNNKLLAIRPPCEITRVPQSVKNKKWKANEWKSFLLYYSLICLIDVMPRKYVQHWLLFVYSIYIFSKTKFTDNEFEKAEKALYEFVLNVELLYGKENMNYNVHMMLHLPNYVKKYSALWAWSAFPFEHFNGIIGKIFHGTQCVPLQIFKIYSRIRYIKENSDIFSRPNCSRQGKKLFQDIMKETKIIKCIKYGDDLRIYGKSVDITLSLSQKLLVELLLQKTITEKVKSYQRFSYKGTLYHSFKYFRLIKRNNSTVILLNGELMTISDLILINMPEVNGTFFVVLGKKLQIMDEELNKYKSDISTKMFSFIARETNNDISCFPSDFDKKCCNMLFKEDKLYIVPLVNTVEIDTTKLPF